MSAALIILGCAIGLPLVIAVLLAVCGSIIWVGKQFGHLVGLEQEGALLCGMALWFAVGGAGLGALVALGAFA